ncbi:hypothetical protein AK830_g12089 [Neonectria ditissima]|uniref:Amino acid permease/ SLC12A domain-containing protein n=1 Tax=Neonectria ditissima TaxID=78410 RepID=A0A0P7B1C4_9HYPO|nr:hypothetical protein AK830_g12089 [Neonectria ditissima]
MHNHALHGPEKLDDIKRGVEEGQDVLSIVAIAEDGNARIYAAFAELAHTKRGLKQRHIQMIALAGMIGTGLFLATGKALARGGPLGILRSYGIVGMLICCMVFSVAEISALAPLSGGVASPQAGAGPNGDPIGFQFWRHPGPFVQYLGIGGSWGQFLGFWRVMSSAAYAFSNIENISPPSERSGGFLIFYVITIFFIGLTVSSADEALTSHSGDAGTPPFSIAAANAGIKVVPSIINAVVVTSAWSAANSSKSPGGRFYYGCQKQNISRDDLPWKGPFQLYAAWASLVSFALLLLTGGFTVFIDGNWSAETFVASYFNIPLIFILYFGYKF